MSPFAGGVALDFGGSDGQFLSSSVLNTFSQIDILDTSAALIHPSVPADRVFKVSSVKEDGYAFLMCMHVVEHVGNPREFVRYISRHVKPGGLIYIEIPLERSYEMGRQFVTGATDITMTIHEHICQFDFGSIPRLVESLDGLSLVDAHESMIDSGWAHWRIGRFLVRRDA